MPTRGMPVATQQDLCTQKYVRHWICSPIPRKARERSLVDETWVRCSMTAALGYLPSLSDQGLYWCGLSREKQHFTSVATDRGTWRR
jgi:hypothetical protein